jgi:glyoxylase-like metal-dependent hydrolase (beta-lactamase superfamily II)
MNKKELHTRYPDAAAKVDILIKGYYTPEGTHGHACSTVTLIEDKELKIVVDPGTLSDPKILFDALKKRNLSLDDINVVFITHSHIDHYKYVGLFPKAKILEYYGWWQGDFWSETESGSDGIINDNIQIIKTPGHSHDSITLLVKTHKGTIAICGDVFWKKNYPKDDPYASDNFLLKKSRQKLLKIADYIIPGHGNIFKVEV